MATLEQIKQKLQEQANKSDRKGSFGDNASYAFWNIPDGSTATLRFLPDGDPANVFFWIERQIIKIPFQGVAGENDRQVIVQVPCVEMFGDTCPILSETRPWWKDPSKEALARQYWKKKSYLFQGFVVNSPFAEETVPENPIRRFVINPSIYEIIKNSLMNPEMEDMPTDYVGGRDFKLAKTRKGEYANYSTSQWSFKVRSLSENERQAIDQHKLFDLKQFLGRRPDADEIDAIRSMFHDSLEGRPFDGAAYGKYYRPQGSWQSTNSSGEESRGGDNAHTTHTPAAKLVSVGEGATVAHAPEPAAATASPVTTAPTQTAKVNAPSAHEILERIKNRTANQGK